MEKRVLIGRTYIETLILNLTQIELTTQSPDVMIKIVTRLEDEVCSLSTLVPKLKEIYVSRYKSLLREYFGREIPLPDSLFDKCFVVNNLLEYLMQNPSLVLNKRYVTSEAENYIKTIVARLGKAAVLTAFYNCGLIKSI